MDSRISTWEMASFLAKPDALRRFFAPHRNGRRGFERFGSSIPHPGESIQLPERGAVRFKDS